MHLTYIIIPAIITNITLRNGTKQQIAVFCAITPRNAGVNIMLRKEKGDVKKLDEFFASPFLRLLCINGWNHAQRKRTSPTP